ALPGPQRGCKLVMAPTKGRKAFICFDEDTTVKNIRQAMKAGFDVPELIKRYTAAGTGPGQWGIPGHNLPLLVAQEHGEPGMIARPTTLRVPLVPISLAALAGSAHDMCKRTPLHAQQLKDGGIMRRVGVWQRARYFSDDHTCRAEIENVRTNVGLLDGSTLGKFRIFGPDALQALQRVYVSDMAKIADGKVKYSAMCNEDGCIVDDGVVVKQGENDYYFTTSTGRAGQTVEWIRYHTRYDGWEFHLVNLTDGLGVINIAGPQARQVLAKVTDADLSSSAFPYAGYREFTVGGEIGVRAMRLGFVGELSFELHVPSSYMAALWGMLAEAGQEFGIRNFGLEAQNVLRMEKGHVIIGSESEQRTTLHDVGLGFLWCSTKPEAKTVGAVALQQTEKQPDRLKLVGIRMENPEETPKDGAIIVESKIRGRVCVARYSTSLKTSVGMALVDAPLAAPGTRLEIFEDGCQGQHKIARVVPMPHYDPDGQQMKM
ncbi:MAG: glycine cleavage T C-terminal barrel domain-containing protein, partial [Desulfobacterales bacterium]